MSDYLANLVSRTFSSSAGVRPQLSSVFEPPSADGWLGTSSTFKAENVSGPSPISSSEAALKSARVFSFQEPAPCKAEQTTPQISPHKKNIPVSEEPERVHSDVAPLRSSAFMQHESHPVRERSKKECQPDSPVLISSSPTRRLPEPISQSAPTLRSGTSRAYGEQTGPLLTRPMVVPRPATASEPGKSESQKFSLTRAVVPPVRSLLEKPASATKPPEPIINVTIGRVEVRAVAPRDQQRAKPKPSAVLSLENYLRQRANGGRR